MTTNNPHEQRLQAMAASQLPVDADRDAARYALAEMERMRMIVLNAQTKLIGVKGAGPEDQACIDAVLRMLTDELNGGTNALPMPEDADE